MRLKDKLARLTPMHAPIGGAQVHVESVQLIDAADFNQAPFEPARVERIAKLRALIGDISGRDRATNALEPREPRARSREPQPLPIGVTRETSAGPVHVIETYLAPEHRHGRVAVRGALSVRADLVAKLALDPRLAEVDFSRMLLLDTETTGLAGGTGTIPFLIGLGFFEDGALKIEQLFLRQLGAERPLLTYLAERMAQASCIVTYNGKSFDWPLVRTRSILCRVPLPEPRAHLDLLHCVRRILKPRMESVRLCEVERALLGHDREDDLPGALIPERYLEYLRGGDPRAMLPVIEHNVSDLVGLAAILPRLVEHFAEVKLDEDPHEHFAFAKVALRAKDFDRATAFARAAAEHGIQDDLVREAHLLVASALRKQGDPLAAAQALLASLARAHGTVHAGHIHHALAKLYERVLRDPASAHRHARLTLEAEGPAAHGSRVGRLRKKLLLRGERPGA